MTTIRSGVEHDEWKSRTLSLRADLKAAGDWSDKEAAVMDDYIAHWFPELDLATIDD